jgi:hypothetical protein
MSDEKPVPVEVREKVVAEYRSEIGRRGGRSRSARKRAAARRNIKIASAQRWRARRPEPEPEGVAP